MEDKQLSRCCLEAAELIDRGREDFSCFALVHAGAGTNIYSNQVQRYVKLFADDECELLNLFEFRKNGARRGAPRRRELRVTALCFAAAVFGERRRKGKIFYG